MKKLHLIDLGTAPIFQQLQLEEALLRGTDQNLCVINRGSPRAIVMGISGQPDALLHTERVKADQIPVIQRFSGGGTVIVDEETLFTTFIFAKDAVAIHPFPEPILRWTAELFQQSWHIPEFQLIENDYVIGALKCGGNAQYIQKDRWLHHTSFLWDYRNENMAYLQLPAKRPTYRASRDHKDFLARLKSHALSKEALIQQLKSTLEKQFELIPTEVNHLTWHPHRTSLRLLTL